MNEGRLEKSSEKRKQVLSKLVRALAASPAAFARLEQNVKVFILRVIFLDSQVLELLISNCLRWCGTKKKKQYITFSLSFLDCPTFLLGMHQTVLLLLLFIIVQHNSSTNT